jgi:hypothetical protein
MKKRAWEHMVLPGPLFHRVLCSHATWTFAGPGPPPQFTGVALMDEQSDLEADGLIAS